MSNIEPDEIESFSLLKDAAATAVYGAEGANGAILITTKRGSISRPKVSFRAEYSLSTPTRLPEFVDSWTYLELANEAHFNDGLDPYIAPEEIEKYRLGIDNDLYPNSKWLDELLSKYTKNQRYTLNFRGGAENAKYFVSMAYFQQDGIFKANPMEKYKGDLGLERYNLRSNIDLRVTRTTNLSIDIAGQYVYLQSPRRSADEIFGFMLITPPHLFPTIYSDGTLATYARETDNNNRNPYNMLMNEGYKRNWTTKIQSNVGIVQDLDVITRGLKLNGKISLDYNGDFGTTREYNPSTYHATGRDAEDNLKFIVPHSGSPILGDPQTSYSSERKIYIEGSLNYQRTFGDHHNVGGMILYTQKETQTSGVAIPYRKQGLVGRLTYSYDYRYFIEGNFGYTGSETFAQKHRFGFFPAIGLGYYVSNERFYPDALKNVMNKIKIRLSYGRTGNDDTGGERFLYRATFSTGGGYFDQGYGSTGSYNHMGGQGVYDVRFINNDIRWEIENKRNIGLDLGFFNNQIELTVDYFSNQRKDILLERNTIPGVAGFHANPWENYGIVNNHGFDADINTHYNLGPVKVSARGTFTYARNKIVEYDELEPAHSWMKMTGSRIGVERVYIAERLYTENDFIKTQNFNGTYSYQLRPGLPILMMGGIDTQYVGPGDVKYKDLNHDGAIDLNDMTRYVGHPYNPEINYGFGFNVEYEGFYASVFFQGTANTSIHLASGNNSFWPFNWGSEKSNFRTAFLDRWSVENPSQDVFMTRLHTTYGRNVSKESNTWWLRDGSFLRFKNLEVGYSVPGEFSKKIGIESARIYLLGYNLHVWDHVKHWDPEHGKRNNGNSYPLSRTFTLGLDLNF
jgi:TonB-linked SusC/RagA family outer membrane protein